MNTFWIYYSSILLAVILTSIVLYFARPIFMPLALGGILALVFMRPSGWFERRGVPRLITAILSGVVFAGLVAGIVLLINWYIHRFAMDLPQLQQKVSGAVNDARHFLKSQWGLRIPGGRSGQPLIDMAAAGRMTTSVLGVVIGVLIHLILIVVYMIMLLSMRSHIRTFFLKLVQEPNKPRIELVMRRSVKVAQEYIYGMLIIIVYLWILYGIAFSIIGVRYAMLFAILCGTLEIIPFVGNITGSTLTCVMALSQGGGIHMVIGILVSYCVIQFSQFYIVSPLVMREQVNLSPLFTIVCLIAGELLWGIPGMILAIPCLAIFKIVCDEVGFLKAFGFLLGGTGKPGKGLRLRSLFRRKGGG
ncbi:MAG TPA: AI-2E family transporter [Puia sp.]|nr:AI-2E family transporter [Puia sp.]